MGSYSDVVDISSEEEDANTNNSNNNFGMKASLEWSEDLIIMDEFSAQSVAIPKKSVVPATLSLSDDDRNYDVSGVGGGDDDDDDCQVLDYDPDKSVLAVSANKADESDEIEVVGAKGEVLYFLIFLLINIIICLSSCLLSC
jgi:hypothetical protein